jgi:hypothetical protein
VQDPIYGFELSGHHWRLKEEASCEDGSRSVRISTNARHQGWDEPDWVFHYDPLTRTWDACCELTYEWNQFDFPEKLLRSLIDFLNNNHPPVMKIHRD